MRIDVVNNPFFVLELAATASVVDVERQGKRLLAELELGRPAARSFPSPFGLLPRDEALVRGAVAQLRDPRLRALYGLLVPPPSRWVAAHTPPAPRAAGRGYPELAAALPAVRAWLRRLLWPRAASTTSGAGAGGA